LLLPALLPVGVTDAYLKAVVRSGAEAAERSASISDLRRHAILLRAALRGYA
jgi:hypothetical protein